MERHRFRESLEFLVPAAGPGPAAFAWWPVGGTGNWWQQELYAWAFQNAQAASRPSLLERALTASGN
jgi:hypothetical protein